MESEVLHRQNVGARFSAAAQTYTMASRLQDRVAARVLAMAPEAFDPGTVLDAGCGPGRLMRLARRRWPGAALVGVDIAAGMIRKARDNFAGEHGVSIVEGDMAAFCWPTPFDLVLSSSAMQWLRPFGQGVAHVANLCRPGGWLSAGLMLDGTLRELHTARAAVAPQKSAAGRLPTPDDVEQAIVSLPGFRLCRLETATEVCHEPSADAVLRCVHDIGVTGGDVSRGRGPLTRRELEALKTWYDGHFSAKPGVSMTFEVGYILAERLS